MSKVRTKADLLRFMEKHGACLEATEWVKSRKEKTFLEIWNACPRLGWLHWLMYEQDYDLAKEWWRYARAKFPTTSNIVFAEDWRSLHDARLALMKRAYRG